MPSFVSATVTGILEERPGLQRVHLRRDAGEGDEKAYVLTDLIGPVAPGDSVVVNITAVELGLGTGGWHVVHWNMSRQEWVQPGGGHVMKLRYTSLQADTGVAEERDEYSEPGSLDGMPVVACLLHSQVAAVAVTVKHLAPETRIAYVMTDGASLPLALSDLMYALRERNLVDVTVSSGQAFGGDLESVNVPSALGVARNNGADVVIVAPGPGVVGTATASGFSGLELAPVLDAAARRGGAPIHALRWSDADARDRHRGLSHHSATVLGNTSTPVAIAVPRGEPTPELGPHRTTEVDVPDVAALFKAAELEVTSMGRRPNQDPRFFTYAAAAGVLATR